MKALIIIKWLKREDFPRWLNPLKLLKRENFQKWLNPLKFRVRKWLNREDFPRWLNPLKLLKRENFRKWLDPFNFRVRKWLKREDFPRWLNPLKLLKRENFQKYDDEMIWFFRDEVMCRHVRIVRIDCKYANNVRKCCKEMDGVETAEFDEEKNTVIVKGWFGLEDLRDRILRRVYKVPNNCILRRVYIAPNITRLVYMVNIEPLEFVRPPFPWETYAQKNLQVNICKEAKTMTTLKNLQVQANLDHAG